MGRNLGRVYTKTRLWMGSTDLSVDKERLDVSKNRGTPKSSILVGFSIINWGTPIFGNTQLDSLQLPQFFFLKKGLGLPFQQKQLRYFTVMCKDDVEVTWWEMLRSDGDVGWSGSNVMPWEFESARRLHPTIKLKLYHFGTSKIWLHMYHFFHLFLMKPRHFFYIFWIHPMIFFRDMGFCWHLWREFSTTQNTNGQIRASPTYADDARVGHVLHPGQVVVVDDRRMVRAT